MHGGHEPMLGRHWTLNRCRLSSMKSMLLCLLLMLHISTSSKDPTTHSQNFDVNEWRELQKTKKEKKSNLSSHSYTIVCDSNIMQSQSPKFDDVNEKRDNFTFSTFTVNVWRTMYSKRLFEGVSTHIEQENYAKDAASHHHTSLALFASHTRPHTSVEKDIAGERSRIMLHARSQVCAMICVCLNTRIVTQKRLFKLVSFSSLSLSPFSSHFTGILLLSRHSHSGLGHVVLKNFFLRKAIDVVFSWKKKRSSSSHSWISDGILGMKLNFSTFYEYCTLCCSDNRSARELICCCMWRVASKKKSEKFTRSVFFAVVWR